MGRRLLSLLVLASTACGPSAAHPPKAPVVSPVGNTKTPICSTAPTASWREVDLSVVAGETRWKNAVKASPCVDRRDCPPRATTCDCDEKGRFVRATRDEHVNVPGDDEVRVRRWADDGCAYFEEIDWDMDGVVDARVRARLDDRGRTIERLAAARALVTARSIYLERDGDHRLVHLEESKSSACSEDLLDEHGRVYRSTSFLEGRCVLAVVYEPPCADPSGPGCPLRKVDCPEGAHPAVTQ